jgi:topoisomerase-4 subunit A
MVYHLIYSDGPKGAIYAKRFNVLGVTRDKEYDLTKGTKGSKVLYFTANPNGESETVTINLKVLPRMKKPQFDYDLGELTIQGRGSGGKQVCKYEVKKITLKSKGVSTLSGRKIWFDDILKRLNTDGRGKYLGSFSGEDLILAVYGSGSYELTNFDLSNHYDDDLRVIRKYKDDIVLSAVHLDGAQKIHFVKRFVPEQVSIGKKVSFISEAPGSKLIVVASGETPAITVKFAKDKKTVPPPIDVFLHEFIDVKGMKAQGNKLSPLKVSEVLLQAGAEPELTEADDPLPSLETAKVTFEVEDKRDGADGNVLKLF